MSGKEDMNKNKLEITIVSAKGLKSRKSNPYVKLKHLGKKHKTKVVQNSDHPRWNEKFTIQINDPTELLEFTVKDKETFRDEVIGELTLQASVFMSTNEVQMKDFDLPTQGSIRFTSKWRGQPFQSSDKAKKSAKKGESEDSQKISALKKSKSKKVIQEPLGLLWVTVVSAEGLRAKNIDPYVKIKHRGKKYKTPYKQNDTNPTWNEKYELPILNRTEIIEIQVKDKDVFSSDDILGTVQFTPDQFMQTNDDQLDTYEISGGEGKLTLNFAWRGEVEKDDSDDDVGPQKQEAFRNAMTEFFRAWGEAGRKVSQNEVADMPRWYFLAEQDIEISDAVVKEFEPKLEEKIMEEFGADLEVDELEFATHVLLEIVEDRERLRRNLVLTLSKDLESEIDLFEKEEREERLHKRNSSSIAKLNVQKIDSDASKKNFSQTPQKSAKDAEDVTGGFTEEEFQKALDQFLETWKDLGCEISEEQISELPRWEFLAEKNSDYTSVIVKRFKPKLEVDQIRLATDHLSKIADKRMRNSLVLTLEELAEVHVDSDSESPKSSPPRDFGRNIVREVFSESVEYSGQADTGVMADVDNTAEEQFQEEVFSFSATNEPTKQPEVQEDATKKMDSPKKVPVVKPVAVNNAFTEEDFRNTMHEFFRAWNAAKYVTKNEIADMPRWQFLLDAETIEVSDTVLGEFRPNLEADEVLLGAHKLRKIVESRNRRRSFITTSNNDEPAISIYSNYKELQSTPPVVKQSEYKPQTVTVEESTEEEFMEALNGFFSCWGMVDRHVSEKEMEGLPRWQFLLDENVEVSDAVIKEFRPKQEVDQIRLCTQRLGEIAENRKRLVKNDSLVLNQAEITEEMQKRQDDNDAWALKEFESANGGMPDFDNFTMDDNESDEIPHTDKVKSDQPLQKTSDVTMVDMLKVEVPPVKDQADQDKDISDAHEIAISDLSSADLGVLNITIVSASDLMEDSSLQGKKMFSKLIYCGKRYKTKPKVYEEILEWNETFSIIVKDPKSTLVFHICTSDISGILDKNSASTDFVGEFTIETEKFLQTTGPVTNRFELQPQGTLILTSKAWNVRKNSLTKYVSQVKAKPIQQLDSELEEHFNDAMMEFFRAWGAVEREVTPEEIACLPRWQFLLQKGIEIADEIVKEFRPRFEVDEMLVCIERLKEIARIRYEEALMEEEYIEEDEFEDPEETYDMSQQKSYADVEESITQDKKITVQSMQTDPMQFKAENVVEEDEELISVSVVAPDISSVQREGPDLNLHHSQMETLIDDNSMKEAEDGALGHDVGGDSFETVNDSILNANKEEEEIQKISTQKVEREVSPMQETLKSMLEAKESKPIQTYTAVAHVKPPVSADFDRIRQKRKAIELLLNANKKSAVFEGFMADGVGDSYMKRVQDAKKEAQLESRRAMWRVRTGTSASVERTPPSKRSYSQEPSVAKPKDTSTRSFSLNPVRKAPQRPIVKTQPDIGGAKLPAENAYLTAWKTTYNKRYSPAFVKKSEPKPQPMKTPFAMRSAAFKITRQREKQKAAEAVATHPYRIMFASRLENPKKETTASNDAEKVLKVTPTAVPAFNSQSSVFTMGRQDPIPSNDISSNDKETIVKITPVSIPPFNSQAAAFRIGRKVSVSLLYIL